jgi:rhamnosyltransferase subunit B
VHVILVPFGSAGDVYPFIGIGTELQRRGHCVSMITAGYFEDLAAKAGFDFAPFMSRADYLDVIGNPDLWHPQRSVALLARRSVIPAIAVIYRLIEERYRPGATVVVAGSLALGARVAQEKLGVPLTTIHLQPVVFRSRFEPPIHPGLGWIRRVPVMLRPAVFRLMDHTIDGIYAKPLNAFRAQLGLAPVKRVMDRWWHSTQAIMALFPDWYASPQPDWPPIRKMTGFPLFDAAEFEPDFEGLAEYLREGEPPIVFTSGTAMATGDKFFAASAGACEILGRRGTIVTKFANQLPRRLPLRVRHIPYVPFSQLLPRAAAFVHHGGIGTSAQALRAGVPQVVSPCSYDQLDNAARLRRLGVSMTMPRTHYTAERVAVMLRELLADRALLARSAARAAAFGAANPLHAVADGLEEIWRAGTNTGLPNPAPKQSMRHNARLPVGSASR